MSLTANPTGQILRATVFLCFLVCLKPVAAAEDDTLIDPTTRVGRITPETSESDLIQIYGEENVQRIEIGVGEGDVVLGTLLFPNSRKELSIEWKHNFENPERITISGSNTEWKTKSGITVGTPLEDLERINTGVFKLIGFESHYPGRTVSWENGSLPIQLQLDLNSNVEIPYHELIEVSGEGYVKSNHATIKKMNLKVVRIYVRWDI